MFLVMPLTLDLMDERKPGEGPGEKDKTVGRLTRTYRNYDQDCRMIVRKERISGTKKTTYRTYFTQKPTVRYQQTNHLSRFLYPVVAEYKDSLLLQDPEVSRTLVELKDEKHYDIDIRHNIGEVTRAVVAASTDNIRLFAESVNKNVFGAVNNKVVVDDSLFYGACLYIHQLPHAGLEIPAMTKPSLNYDVFSLITRKTRLPDTIIRRKMNMLAAAVKAGIIEAELEMKAFGEWIENVKADMESSHYMSPTYTIFGKTPQELEEKVKELSSRLPQGVGVERIPWKQEQLYTTGMAARWHKKSLVVPTTTLGAFYPPAADLLQMSGVFLGTNWHTRAPVWVDLDLNSRNQLVTGFGMPGAGKSFAIKVWIERDAVAKKETPGVYVLFDPSHTGEYRDLVDRLNQILPTDYAIEWRTLDDGLGIDPLAYGPRSAANIMSTLAKLDKDPNYLSLYALLFQTMEALTERPQNATINGLEDFMKAQRDRYEGERRHMYDILVDAAHTALMAHSRIFKGTRPKGSFAFNIYSLDASEVGVALSLAMLRAREFFHSLPPSVLKTCVLDEGYTALQNREAALALDWMSRQERKSGVRLFWLTQRPADLHTVIKSGDKEISDLAVHLVEDSDTQLIFAHNNIAAVKDLLSLSDYEVNMLKPTKTEIEQGRCVLILGGTKNRVSHILLQVNATKEEAERYNTQARLWTPPTKRPPP